MPDLYPSSASAFLAPRVFSASLLKPSRRCRTRGCSNGRQRVSHLLGCSWWHRRRSGWWMHVRGEELANQGTKGGVIGAFGCLKELLPLLHSADALPAPRPLGSPACCCPSGARGTTPESRRDNITLTSISRSWLGCPAIAFGNAFKTSSAAKLSAPKKGCFSPSGTAAAQSFRNT